MSRPGDKGPYAPWNVKIIEAGKNVSEGLLGKPKTDITKQKMSKNNARARLGKKHSRKTKIKMSKDRTGIKNPFFGRKHSLETRKKMSVSQCTRYGDKS